VRRTGRPNGHDLGSGVDPLIAQLAGLTLDLRLRLLLVD
jgi:hypothetical protein